MNIAGANGGEVAIYRNLLEFGGVGLESPNTSRSRWECKAS